MSDMPRSPWNTPGEAADKLELSTRQVAELGDAGQIDMIRTDGGQRRYLRESVDELARRRAAAKDRQ